METRRLETLKQIAAGVAAQFGSNCEVVIHDVSGNRPDHTKQKYKSSDVWNVFCFAELLQHRQQYQMHKDYLNKKELA